MSSAKSGWHRTDMLQQWQEGGGLLIMGYEMYRNMCQHKFIKSKKQKRIIDECLVDPGNSILTFFTFTSVILRTHCLFYYFLYLYLEIYTAPPDSLRGPCMTLGDRHLVSSKCEKF